MQDPYGRWYILQRSHGSLALTRKAASSRAGHYAIGRSLRSPIACVQRSWTRLPIRGLTKSLCTMYTAGNTVQCVCGTMSGTMLLAQGNYCIVFSRESVEAIQFFFCIFKGDLV